MWRGGVRAFSLGVALAATSTLSFAADRTVALVAGGLGVRTLRCFEPPKGLNPPYPSVTLIFNMRPDGTLDGPPQLADPPGGNAKSAAVTSAILSAASRCARLDGPERYRTDYLRWRSVKVVINPNQSR